MTVKKMILTILLLVLSSAVSRTEGFQSGFSQWQMGADALAPCGDEQVINAVDGRVLVMHVKARQAGSAGHTHLCGMAGNIESTLESFFSNPKVVMLGAVIEAGTGLRPILALRNLVEGALKLASPFLVIENSVNPGRSMLL